MEFKARHAQPFTLEQAILLEVSVITTEIARLQNSLTHLRDTQQQLQENLDSEGHSDPVILEAFKENEVVISSQGERISMLRLALELKGLVSQKNTHYDLSPSRSPSHKERRMGLPEEGEEPQPDIEPDAGADGVFL